MKGTRMIVARTCEITTSSGDTKTPRCTQCQHRSTRSTRKSLFTLVGQPNVYARMAFSIPSPLYRFSRSGAILQSHHPPTHHSPPHQFRGWVKSACVTRKPLVVCVQLSPKLRRPFPMYHCARSYLVGSSHCIGTVRYRPA